MYKPCWGMITEIRSEAFAAAKVDEMFSGFQPDQPAKKIRCQDLMIGTEMPKSREF